MIKLQTAENALKTVYLNVVRNQLNTTSNKILSKINHTTEDVWGKEIRKLVDNGNGEYLTLVSELKNLYHTIELSDKAIRASEQNAGAFVNLLNAEFETLLKKSEKTFSEMLFKKDKEIVVEAVNGIEEKTTFRNNLINGIVDILDPNKEEIFRYNRAEYKILQPNVKELEKLSEFAIYEFIEQLDNEYSTINTVVCSPKNERLLREEILNSGREVQYIDIAPNGRVMSLNNIPVIKDREIDDNTIYCLDINEFTFHQLCDWLWLEGENGQVLRLNPLSKNYEATLVKYGNLICKDISKQGVLKIKE